MTRSFIFTDVTSAVHSIWSLIQADSSFIDPTFSTAQYVPNKVRQLNITSTVIANLYMDTNDEVGAAIAANGTSYLSSMINDLDLNTISIKPSSGTNTINVTIEAL